MNNKNVVIVYALVALSIYVFKLVSRVKRRILKNDMLIFAVLGCAGVMFFAGCEKTPEQQIKDAKEKAGDVKQDLKEAHTAYLAEWDTFRSESEQSIEANEKNIDAFKDKMDIAGTKAKKKYKKAVAELEQRNRDLKKKLEEYKDEGESKWTEFKRNFQHDLDAMGKTLKDLVKDDDERPR